MAIAERPEENPGRTIDDPAQPGPGGGANRRAWTLALAAALAAAVGSWLAVEGVLDAYRPSLMPPMKPIPTDEDTRQILLARVASGTAAFAATGGLFGLAFGPAGGAWRRSAGSAGLAGGLGLLAGAFGGGAVARLALPLIYPRLGPLSDDLLVPLLGHEALWPVVGLAGGLAFGLGVGGRGRWLRVAIGGLVGAVVATAAFEVAGALAFPSHRTHLPLAGSPEARALAQILVALGTAIGSVLAMADPKEKPASR